MSHSNLPWLQIKHMVSCMSYQSSALSSNHNFLTAPSLATLGQICSKENVWTHSYVPFRNSISHGSWVEIFLFHHFSRISYKPDWLHWAKWAKKISSLSRCESGPAPGLQKVLQQNLDHRSHRSCCSPLSHSLNVFVSVNQDQDLTLDQ